MPVPSDERVFPGGTDVTLVSSPKIPEDGELVEPDPQIIEGDVDFDVSAVLAELNVDFDGAQSYRYVYQTGPGTGAEAEATIIAEANLDSSTDRHETITQIIEVEPDDSFGLPSSYALPMIIENEGQ